MVSFVIRRFFARLGRLTRELRPRSVLDAGCGEGEVLRRGVLDKHSWVVSLDLQQGALDAVRAHSKPGGMVLGSVLELPFAAASYDLVLCTEVLEHLENPLQAVNEAARVARQAVIFSVPWEPWFRAGNFVRGKYMADWGNFPEHVQHWNFASFRELLGRRYATVHLEEAFPWILAMCRTADKRSK